MTRWSELVATTALGESWDLLRLDLRGQGDSRWRGRIGMGEWCADIAAILEREGYPRAVVAGHCLGANIAAELAVRYPARIEGVILIEPMLREALTGTMGRIARLRWMLRPAVRLVRALNGVGLYRRRLAALDLELLDRQTRSAVAATGSSERLLARYASPLLDLQTTATGPYLQGLMAVTQPPSDLGAIRSPVLALLSAGSTFSDPDRTRALLRAVPSCRVVMLPARHWIPTEQPEAMRRAIEEWCGQLARPG